jgi:hypothetical protein
VVAIDLPGFGRTPTEGDSASIHANRVLLSALRRARDGPARRFSSATRWAGCISLHDRRPRRPSPCRSRARKPGDCRPRRAAFFDSAVAAIFAGYCLPGIGELLMTGRKALLGSEGSVRQMLDFCCVDSSRVDPEVVAATIALSQERTKTAGGNAAFLSAARSIVMSVLRRGEFARMVERIAVRRSSSTGRTTGSCRSRRRASSLPGAPTG